MDVHCIWAICTVCSWCVIWLNSNERRFVMQLILYIRVVCTVQYSKYLFHTVCMIYNCLRRRRRGYRATRWQCAQRALRLRAYLSAVNAARRHAVSHARRRLGRLRCQLRWNWANSSYPRPVLRLCPGAYISIQSTVFATLLFMNFIQVAHSFVWK